MLASLRYRKLYSHPMERGYYCVCLKTHSDKLCIHHHVFLGLSLLIFTLDTSTYTVVYIRFKSNHKPCVWDRFLQVFLDLAT